MGVLASLMTNQYPRIDTYDPLDVERLRGSRTQNQTALLALQEAQRQSQAEAAYRQAVQQNPGLLFGGGSQQPLLGQLGPGGAPAGGPPGAITQQAFGPGGPGAAQQVGAYPDLSQFAGGPPPVLSSLAASPRPGVPASSPSPQATLMQMARVNPDAALLLQGRMQQQEELGYKRQEQGLKIREKLAETTGQLLGGAHDQASYDVIRRQLAEVSPQWAAALPQVYSAEGVQPFIDAAIDAKSRAALGIQQVEAQAQLMKARREGISAPVTEYLGTLNKTWETATPQERAWAIQQAEAAKERVSALHGAGQIKETPGGMVRIGKTGEVEYLQAPGGGPLLGKPTEAEQKAGTYYDLAKSSQAITAEMEKKGFQPGFWEKLADQKLPYGISNYLTGEDYQKYKQAVGEFAAAWLRKTSGANVTQMEWDMTDQIYFPQPGNSKDVIEQKRQARERITRNLEEEARATGRTGGPAPQGGAQAAPSGGQPTSQAPAGGKVVSRADLHAEARRRNISPAQAEQMAISKGYTVQ
jgi:hypothetical protein